MSLQISSGEEIFPSKAVVQVNVHDLFSTVILVEVRSSLWRKDLPALETISKAQMRRIAWLSPKCTNYIKGRCKVAAARLF